MMGTTGIQNAHMFRLFIYLVIFTISGKANGNNCFSSTTVSTITCESSIPEFDKENNVSILNFIKCTTGHLSNKTFINLNSLSVLSISCEFSGDAHLGLESGTFTSVKSSLKQLNLNHNNIKSLPDRIFCELANVTSIDLSKNSLIDIEASGFGSNCGKQSSTMKLQELNIQENEIKIFKNGTFDHLPQVYFLNASHNALRHIELYAFEGMDDLLELDLTSNRLTLIPPRLFQNLTKLRFLHLSKNGLTSIALSNVTYPEGLQTLDISRNRLTTIDSSMFLNLKQLSGLDLSYNQLRVIGSGFESLVSLSSLSLNNAGIEEIKSGAFRALSVLRDLDLDDNELRKLESGTIDDLSQLHYLRLSGNNLRALPKAKNWHNMQEFKVARNAISDLSTFASYDLQNLKELDLSENLIEIILRETFRNSTTLYKLNLSHNKIRQIEKNAFDSLAPSWYNGLNLNLDNNEITSVDNLFQTSNLTSISLNGNKLTNFSYSGIPFSLQSIFLNHNQISKIINELSFSIFENTKIKTMDLSYNRLTKIALYDIPYSIEELDLHNNSIGHVDELFLKPLSRLKTINLHNNKLEMLCPQMLVGRYQSPMLTTTLSGNPFFCSCELEWLKYQNSDISSNFGYIKDLQFVKCHSMVPRNGTQYRNITQVWNSAMFLCKSTDQRSNSCQCTLSNNFKCDLPCPKKCTCYRNAVFDFVIVDCSASNLTTMPAITFRDVSTVQLFMDGNNVNSINASSFHSYSNIKKLYLNNSQLRVIEENAFQTLASLEVLQLSSNMLQELPSGIFSGLSNLKELYVARNRLVQLQDDIFSPLTSLLILHLNNNFLGNFSVWELAKLKLLKDVSLQNNQWSCDCKFIDKFRDWLQEYVNIVHDADKLVCTAQPTGQEIPLISFSFDDCYKVTPLQYLASWSPVWGSILTVLLVLFLTIIFVFIYRREMQVLIYSRYGVRIFSKDSGETDQNKSYDAFISYSCLDEDFLLNEFLPGLEQIENPYHLCLHHRDFIVGAFITDNILEAVEKSRRTIMLLSHNFIKSEWCRFEFKTAHVQMLRDRCNRVIIVVLGDVPNDLDPEMKLYLTTNTFLKWGDKLFWQKLYFVLPDKNT